ncbi:hypothetical protein CRENPOLYSF1_240016 [Crenothrix polyspora]|uniref:Uncharacterized protein n=1 Tax=Crenothrix polyspora TaxID=360316 RepID=A0A1R4H873_9GAMM|nr:hypothetical protein CRENPOLYSF1_240016 [Crenothrix polyspora]
MGKGTARRKHPQRQWHNQRCQRLGNRNHEKCALSVTVFQQTITVSLETMEIINVLLKLAESTHDKLQNSAIYTSLNTHYFGTKPSWLQSKNR